MKKIYTLVALLTAIGAQSVSAQYCTCPPYSSGPFTGFTNVTFQEINNNSGLDATVDYTSQTGDVDPGTSPTMTVDVQHEILNTGTFTDMVEIRVWVDWNQDYDFTDAGEEVVTATEDLSIASGSINNETFTYSISVPSGATAGATRMRCYTDMLIADGHEAPNPCGYGGSLGQHGEVEDYTLNVSGGGGAAVSEIPAISYLTIFPNPSKEVTNIKFEMKDAEQTSIKIVNILGETVLELSDVYNQGPNMVSIETSDLESGIYLLTISTANGRVTQELVIQ